MYAVIETGGKQYRVQQGDLVKVEKLAVAEGETVIFDRVLLVSGENGVKIGSPVVDGATVSGTVKRQGKAKKIIVFKYKPKKNYRRKNGHRQPYTQILIDAVNA